MIGIFAAISVISAVLACVSAEAFATLMWLWLLPVSFLGNFLALLILWCIMLLVMAKLVDLNAKYEHDAPFYRWVADKTIRLAIRLLRVNISMEGLEKAPKSGRFLLVCNHLNDVDPAVLLMAFPKSQLAFISKRENDKLFVLGPFLRRMGCQPINRENDREALKTILTCIEIIKDDRMSVGVFPEGYIHGDNLLHPFRHGVFKIAQRTGVPIVVCTLQGTQHVLKNAVKLKPSSVQMHLVGVIDDVKGRSAVELGEQAYAMMAEDLGPELVLQR